MKHSDLKTVFTFLQKECEAAKTTLTEVCAEAGVDRSNPEKWKAKNPKTLDSLASMLEVIERKKKRKKKS